MSIAHGGNVYEIASRLGCSPDAILDYSASINPLGPPPGLAEEFNAHFHRLQHYPDIRNRSLLNALADFHGLPPERVVVGNGSTELIYWLPRALGVRKAVVALPTFGEYRKAFELEGIELHKVMAPYRNNFQPTVDELDSICSAVSPDAILLTNPGSPSGTLLPSEVREWVVRRSRRGGIHCIVDEVFVDFCEGESLKAFLEEAPQLVLIRSMTKFYGVPGLRLGYLLCSDGTAERVRHFLPPWSVNTLAQAAGTYCLSRDAYREETLRLVESERDRMSKSLSSMGAGHVFPGSANYLLVKLADHLPPASVLQQDLLASDHILIRDCCSFEGLDDRYIRLAVRLPEQNRRVLDGIARWIRARKSS